MARYRQKRNRHLEILPVELRHRESILTHVKGPVAGVDDVVVDD